MPRQKRADEGGLIYHALNRGNARQTIFHKNGDYEAFLRVLGEGLQRYPVGLFSFALLPNHWHMVLRPSEDGLMGRMLRWVTATHTQRHHAHYHSSGEGHLYQARFKSFPLADDDVDPKLLAPWPIARSPNWAARVNQPLSEKELKAVRGCVQRGRPFGDEAWTEKGRPKNWFGLHASASRTAPKEVAASNKMTPVPFSCHTLDEDSKLYDAEARWIDPHSGRFISEDPTGFAGGDTNLFRYGFNSPTNFVDPSGQVAESIWDFASLSLGVWSLQNSIKQGDVTGATIDAVGIVVDAAALLIPVVPGGAGVAIKAIRGAEAGRKAAGALQKAKRFSDIAKNTVRATDLGLQAASTGVSIGRGDSLGAALGATGLGIRGLQGVGTARRLLSRTPDIPRSATDLPLLPVVNPRFDISDELLEARGLTRACFTPGHEIQVPRQDEGIASLPAAVSEIESGTLDEHLATLLAVGLISASAVYGINAAVRTAKNKKRQYDTSVDELFAQLSNEQLTWS